jgi:hypothetical protein
MLTRDCVVAHVDRDTSPFFERARLLLSFDHVVSFIEHANRT